MENQNEIVKVEDHGLSAEKVSEVHGSFAPAIDKKKSLVPEYEGLLTMEINAETCKKAGDLRKKLMKVRTQGIEKTRKAQKDFSLKLGQVIDSFAKKETVHLQQMESNLSDIEKHHENAEKERIAKLNEERADALRKLGVEFIPAGLAQMELKEWEQYLWGQKLAKKAQDEADAKAEAERIAKEEADKKEQERVRLENEQLKKEAEEKRIADDLAQKERDRVDKERLDKQQEERDARNRADAKREADAAKIKADHETELKAERDAAQLLKDEQAKKDAKIKADMEIKEEADKVAADKAADKEHRAKIHNEVMKAISGLDAKGIVIAIAKGDIPHVSINY